MGALAVDAVFVPEERAQMVIAPPPLTVTTEDSPLGLYVAFRPGGDDIDSGGAGEILGLCGLPVMTS